MSDSVGSISLDLVIKESIDKDISAAVSRSKGTVQSASADISKAMAAPFEKAAKDIQAPLKQMEKTVDDSFDRIKKVKKSALGYDRDAMKFIDEYVGKLNNSKSSGSNPPAAAAPKVDTADVDKMAKRMYEEFNVAQKPLDLLYQKQESINAQIDQEREKLKQTCQEYAKIALASEENLSAESKYQAEIEKIRSKIMSLQGASNRVAAQINKSTSETTDKIKKQVESAASDTVATVNKTVSQAAPPVTKLANTIKSAASDTTATVNKTVSKAASPVIKLTNTVKSAASGARSHVNGELGSTEKKLEKTSKSGTSAFTKLAKNIKSAFKSVFLLSVLYAGFKSIKTFFGDAVSGNKQFSDSLNQVKNNLAVAFAPIFNAVMPALTALMQGLAAVTKGIAAFIAGLFGQTYAQAEKAAGKLKSVSNESKKTAKTTGDNLQSFDKVNVRKKEDKGSSTGGAPNPGGTEAYSRFAKKVKNTFGELKNWVKKNFSMDFSQIGNNFKSVFGSMKEIASGTFGGIKNTGLSAFGAISTLFTGVASVASKKINTLSEGIKKFFNKNKKNIINGVNNISTNLTSGFDGLKRTFGTVFDAMGDSVDRMRPKVSNSISKLLGGISGYALSIGGIVSGAFSVFTEKAASWADNNREKIGSVFDSFQKLGSDAMELAGGIFGDIASILSQWWENDMKPIWGKFSEAVLGIGDTVMNVWNEWIYPVVEKLIKWAQELWDNHLKGLFETAISFIGKVVDCVSTLWNKWLKPYVDWLIKYLKPPIMAVINTILGVVRTVIGVVSDVIKGILKSLGGLLDFITGIFSGDWKKAWKGIKDFFGGIWDAIWGIVKGAINLIIDGLNAVWSAIYSFVSGIVNAVGGIAGLIGKAFGQDWNFSMPAEPPLIPKLATGGLATAPTLAMVGDNRNASSDPEVIAPLSKLKEYINPDNEEVIILINQLITEVKLGVKSVVNAICQMIVAIQNKDLIGSPESFVRYIYPYIAAEGQRSSNYDIGGFN